MNARHRAKMEAQAKLKKELGEVEYARQRAETLVNEKAREVAAKLVIKDRELAIHETVDTMQYIMAIVLNDEYGFGHKRINKILDRMRSQMDCVVQGHVTGEEIKKWCADRKITIRP